MMLWNDPGRASPESSEKFKRYVADLRVLLRTVPAEDHSEFLSALVYVTAAGFCSTCAGGDVGAVAAAMTASAVGTATRDPAAGLEAAKTMLTAGKDQLNPSGGPGRG